MQILEQYLKAIKITIVTIAKEEKIKL